MFPLWWERGWVPTKSPILNKSKNSDSLNVVFCLGDSIRNNKKRDLIKYGEIVLFKLA